MDDNIGWEDTLKITQRLMELYPQQSLDNISLGDIYHWTIHLPEFHDDLELANDEILNAIFQEWYEETNPL